MNKDGLEIVIMKRHEEFGNDWFFFLVKNDFMSAYICKN